MKFFISTGYADPDEVVLVGRAAEDAGIDGISFADHLFFPTERTTSYPYSGDGSLPFSLDTSWPDVFVLVGALATATTRLEFLTHVYILPLRHPLAVAKSAATAAVLSNNRLLLGVGVGWMREEFDTLGAPFHRRGRITETSIGILREIWTTGAMREYHDDDFDIPALVMRPVPTVPVPILVGGESERALERAARLGDGFVTLKHATHEKLLSVIDDMRARVRRHGRDPDDFHINARASDQVKTDELASLADRSVASLRFSLWPPEERRVDVKLAAIERFANEVVEPYRRQAGSPSSHHP